ncbi:hypothetical protein EsH8_V_001062 [Colletotrichum jinshuiense]
MCRAVFSGNDAQIRKLKKIREILEMNKGSLMPLFQDLGEAKLVDVVRQLLEARIFESTLRAKIEFPELFRTSPQRDAQREASEADAARSTAEALDEITRSEQDCAAFSQVDLQQLTETIAVKGESDEDILDKEWPKLPTLAVNFTGSSINEVLVPNRQLRHTAVHRLPTTAREISHLLRWATRLAEVLQDPIRVAQLVEMKSEIDNMIEAMELTKNVLEDRTIATLNDISLQKQELDKREKYAVQQMLAEDRDHKALIGRLLGASVENIFIRRKNASEPGDLDDANFEDACASFKEDKPENVDDAADGVDKFLRNHMTASKARTSS